MSSGFRTSRRLFLEPLEGRRLLASDFLLEIEGIKGESQESGHEGAIEIDSFSWGASNSRVVDPNQVQDFRFVTQISKASPLLLKAVATSAHIPKAVLHIRKQGGVQEEYLQIKMTDVLVSSVQRQSLNEELPKEEIALNFTKIEQRYCPADPSGAPGDCSSSAWDVANVKLEPSHSLLDERTSPNIDETDAFLAISGIKGESTDSKHKDEIQIESFSWGMYQSTHGTGGGGGAGKVSMQDVHFVMKSSKASPLLAKAVATGEHIKKVEFSVRKAGGEAQEYYTIKLADVLVTSYQSVGHSDSEPLEEITLNFASLTESYSATDPRGSQSPPVVTQIDANARNSDGSSILDKTVPAPEANDMFLEIQGIKGESNDSKHKDTIEIYSYSWGLSQTGAFGTGGGGGAGKVSYQDMNFVSKVSKATPLLMKAVATGEHIKKVEFSVRKSSGKMSDDYLAIELEDSLISSYQTQSLNESTPSDQFSINFTKIEFEYKPQKPDGSLDAPVKSNWIVPNNAKHEVPENPLFAVPDPGATAGHDFFLEIDGVKGESTDSKHKEAIEISSYSWGVNQGTHAGGGGGGAGKVSYQDIHFVASVGKASPLLVKAVATGAHIKKAVLYGRKAGAAQDDYLTIKLSDVLVSSYQVRGIDNAQPLEEITINFSKMDVRYESQSATGVSSPTTASLTVDKKHDHESGPSILEATHSQAAAVDYFLEIDGVKGESTDSKHKDAIEISSYSWGLSQTGTFGTGGGGGAGKVQMQDFHFVMNTSSATPDLLAAMASGNLGHLDQATLALRHKNPTKIDHIVYNLEDSLISSYRTKGTVRSTPQEEISLNFATIEQKVQGDPNDPRLPPGTVSSGIQSNESQENQEGASILDDTTPDAAAHDIFLEIEGVKGESKDDKFMGSIELESYSWGMSQSISGSARNVGRPKFEDFHFDADYSSASVELLGLLAEGKHIAKATLTVRKAGERQDDYFQFTLTDVVISSYQLQGEDGVTPSNPFSMSPGQIAFNFVRSTRPAEGTRPENTDVLFADPNELLSSA